jgi:hypothetical protein
MMIIFRRFLLVVFAGLALAACETQVPVQRLPEITFGHLPKIGLNVADLQVVNDYKPTFQEPNIEHLMSVPPATVMQRWAEQRLEARGVTNAAKFTIVDAQVKASPLKVDSGITGAFKVEQSVRYDATVAGMLEIFDDRGFRRAFASARVSRSRTVPENASVNEREKVWFELIEALMRDFDAEMEQNIRAHVGGFVM